MSRRSPVSAPRRGSPPPRPKREAARLAALRDRLWASVARAAPEAVVFGAAAPRLPNTLAFADARRRRRDAADRPRSRRRRRVVGLGLFVGQGDAVACSGGDGGRAGARRRRDPGQFRLGVARRRRRPFRRRLRHGAGRIAPAPRRRLSGQSSRDGCAAPVRCIDEARVAGGWRSAARGGVDDSFADHGFRRRAGVGRRRFGRRRADRPSSSLPNARRYVVLRATSSCTPALTSTQAQGRRRAKSEPATATSRIPRRLRSANWGRNVRQSRLRHAADASSTRRAVPSRCSSSERQLSRASDQLDRNGGAAGAAIAFQGRRHVDIS